MSAPDESSQPKGEPAGTEHRQSVRAPIRLRVDYERMNTFFADYTKNISKGGTFIKTSRPLPLGTRFVFTLSVPALSEPVALSGEVAWALGPDDAAARGAEAGMGIRFIFADDASRGQFEKLVERMMVESLGKDVTERLLRG
jgi:type IV pilus assembly protein PilZ